MAMLACRPGTGPFDAGSLQLQPRGLLAQKPPALCADCHPGGHTHGIYDGRGTLPNTLPSNIRFEGSGCVECHRQIHGSNAPASAFGQWFIR